MAQPQNQIRRAQQGMTVNYGAPTVFDQPLYDRVNFPAAGTTAQLNFFSTQFGATATLIRAGATGSFQKTKRDTNLTTSGQVSGKTYVVGAISVAYIHEDEGEVTNPTDRDKLRNGGWCEFKIGDGLVFELPLVYVPEMNPIVIGSTTVTNTTMLGSVGGGSLMFPRLKFRQPVTIPPNQSFTFNMNWDGTVALTKAIDIQVYLHSVQLRPGS